MLNYECFGFLQTTGSEALKVPWLRVMCVPFRGFINETHGDRYPFEIEVLPQALFKETPEIVFEQFRVVAEEREYRMG